jgi:RNA recognition motif-containing protein
MNISDKKDLPFSCDEESLKKYFSGCGEIKGAEV